MHQSLEDAGKGSTMAYGPSLCVYLFEKGFCYMAQAGLELVYESASVTRATGTTGTCSIIPNQFCPDIKLGDTSFDSLATNKLLGSTSCHSLCHRLITPKSMLPAHMPDILTEIGRNSRMANTLGDSGDLREQEPSGFHYRGGSFSIP